MSEQHLTAPVTAKVGRRVKPEEEEEEIPTASAITTTRIISSVAVESPKRRKVESSAAESEPPLFPIAKKHRSRLSTSPRKLPSRKEKNDSAAEDDNRRRLQRSGFVSFHAPSCAACSEEESSGGAGSMSADPGNDWFKSDTSSHDIFDSSVVSTSPESEVCVDLAEKEMESKSTESSTQHRSVSFEAPTAAEEIEEFFLAAEKAQAQRFKDKYNFDIVNDVPVKGGRFEWSRVKH